MARSGDFANIICLDILTRYALAAYCLGCWAPYDPYMYGYPNRYYRQRPASTVVVVQNADPVDVVPGVVVATEEQNLPSLTNLRIER